MKRLILLLSILFTVNTFAQYGLRAPEKEHFILSLHLDHPKTLNNPENDKERGLQYNIEVGLRGALGDFIGAEVKVGYDNFPSLYGGYEAFTGSFGIRLVSGFEEEWNYYLGFKASKVYRTSERLGRAYRINPGLEIVVTREVFKGFDVGLRYTLDEANDQEIFDWDVENRQAFFITFVVEVFEL